MNHRVARSIGGSFTLWCNCNFFCSAVLFADCSTSRMDSLYQLWAEEKRATPGRSLTLCFNLTSGEQAAILIFFFFLEFLIFSWEVLLSYWNPPTFTQRQTVSNAAWTKNTWMQNWTKGKKKMYFCKLTGCYHANKEHIETMPAEPITSAHWGNDLQGRYLEQKKKLLFNLNRKPL